MAIDVVLLEAKKFAFILVTNKKYMEKSEFSY